MFRFGKAISAGERTDLEKSFREALMDLFIAPIRRLKSLSGRRVDGDFWALRDVSFDLPEGQVLELLAEMGLARVRCSSCCPEFLSRPKGVP